ncbi:hypothetical protein NE683_18910 [Bariatricus massiliensis]|uniref:Uncharacterized protein n=1 Tax=Bariatricus massiliensis TaxID=1745713 RepID=A0ABS8DL86_9FIRM|nr:hypothetical protein [Bariatricus massiliensis]MCB7306062.1 hypothetical protein [Bariatricus massiliensis]MCB7376569.1 hypothetical protein [Bariatricus massiliensis]MCB7389205.1 hypothetical protein [Bariatricus massiliensis]MCB7413378.1 hypothetical protein [Bariatricus massiliensis]MCQ5255294.1 hypothetical protein [Bariatricus massiliensis]
MELTQEFFIALGNNYSDANIERALEHVDYLISEEEAYFELGTAAVKEELAALSDLVREFASYIQKGRYRFLKKLIHL